MKKLLLTISLVSSITANNCYAQNVVLLEKDSPAPYKGYLFTEDEVRKIRSDLIELDTLRLVEISYNRTLELYKKNEVLYNDKINMLVQQNDKLVTTLSKSQEVNNWERFFWFSAGIFITGAGVYLGSKVVK